MGLVYNSHGLLLAAIIRFESVTKQLKKDGTSPWPAEYWNTAISGFAMVKTTICRGKFDGVSAAANQKNVIVAWEIDPRGTPKKALAKAKG
jgi:hypothetical protein